jgi:hypothetical protein
MTGTSFTRLTASLSGKCLERLCYSQDMAGHTSEVDQIVDSSGTYCAAKASILHPSALSSLSARRTSCAINHLRDKQKKKNHKTEQRLTRNLDIKRSLYSNELRYISSKKQASITTLMIMKIHGDRQGVSGAHYFFNPASLGFPLPHATL